MIISINLPIDPADAITSVVATFKQRDQWSRKTARDPRVKLMHRHVLRSLALCARTDSGGMLVIDPTYAELAKAARCDRSTAIRAVNVAEQIGIVRKVRHSDGRVSNAFELLVPASNGGKNPGSNGGKFPVPTVANLADAYAGSDAGSNGVKTPEKTQEVQRPTVANLADAEGSNGRTAATVLRVESKVQEDRPVTTTNTESDHEHTLSESYVGAARARATDTCSPEPLAPMQRAEALHETVEPQSKPPSTVSQHPATSSASRPIGRPAHGTNGAGGGPPDFTAINAAFPWLLATYPKDRIGDEGRAYFALCRAVDAVGLRGVTEAVEDELRQSSADVLPLAELLLAVVARQAHRTNRQ